MEEFCGLWLLCFSVYLVQFLNFYKQAYPRLSTVLNLKTIVSLIIKAKDKPTILVKMIPQKNTQGLSQNSDAAGSACQSPWQGQPEIGRPPAQRLQ
jgi:hypothetical protein